MKKSIVLILLSLFIFACSHKSVPSASGTSVSTLKTSSATVTNEQFLQGKTVFEASCGKCHKYRDPASHTVKQWTYWLNKMAPKAKLTDEQKSAVFNFVSVNAKP